MMSHRNINTSFKMNFGYPQQRVWGFDSLLVRLKSIYKRWFCGHKAILLIIAILFCPTSSATDQVTVGTGKGTWSHCQNQRFSMCDGGGRTILENGQCTVPNQKKYCQVIRGASHSCDSGEDGLYSGTQTCIENMITVKKPLISLSRNTINQGDKVTITATARSNLNKLTICRVQNNRNHRCAWYRVIKTCHNIKAGDKCEETFTPRYAGNLKYRADAHGINSLTPSIQTKTLDLTVRELNTPATINLSISPTHVNPGQTFIISTTATDGNVTNANKIEWIKLYHDNNPTPIATNTAGRYNTYHIRLEKTYSLSKTSKIKVAVRDGNTTTIKEATVVVNSPPTITSITTNSKTNILPKITGASINLTAKASDNNLSQITWCKIAGKNTSPQTSCSLKSVIKVCNVSSQNGVCTATVEAENLSAGHWAFHAIAKDTMGLTSSKAVVVNVVNAVIPAITGVCQWNVKKTTCSKNSKNTFEAGAQLRVSFQANAMQVGKAAKKISLIADSNSVATKDVNGSLPLPGQTARTFSLNWTPGSNYYNRNDIQLTVKIKDTADNEFTSRTTQIQVAQQPATPTLTIKSPLDASERFVLNLQATKVAGGVVYEFYENNNLIQRDTKTGMTLTKSYSDHNKTFTYKVRGINKHNVAGNFGTQSITINNLEPTPVKPTLKGDNTQYHKVTLSWESLTHSNYFELQRQNRNRSWSTVPNVNQTPYTWQNTPINQSYNYRLRACNSRGSCSQYSKVKTIKVEDHPMTQIPGVTLGSPFKSKGQWNMTVTLGAISGAKQVRLFENGNLIRSVAGKHTIFKSYADHNKQFTYCASALNHSDKEGEQGNCQKIQVDHSEPIGIPAIQGGNTQYGSSVSLIWGASNRAIQYQLQCKGCNGNTWQNSYIGSETNFTWTNASINKSYQFRLRAKNSQGTWSAFSTVKTVSVEASVLQGSPSVRLAREYVQNHKKHYQFYISALTGGASYRLYENGQPVNSASFTVSKAYQKHGETFTYCADALNQSGRASQRGTSKQCHTIIVSHIERVLSPKELKANQLANSNNVKVSWSPNQSVTTNNPAFYHLQRRQMTNSHSNQYGPAIDIVKNPNTAYASKNIESTEWIESQFFGQYQYRVRACSQQYKAKVVNESKGCSAYSGWQSITVIAPKMRLRGRSLPVSGHKKPYHLTAAAIPGANGYHVYQKGPLDNSYTRIATSTKPEWTANMPYADHGKSFSYEISAVNTANFESRRSQAVTIKVNHPEPKPAKPTFAIGRVTPVTKLGNKPYLEHTVTYRVQWSAAIKAHTSIHNHSFRLQARSKPDTTGKWTAWHKPVKFADYTATNQFMLPDDEFFAGQYQYRVAACNRQRVCSAWVTSDTYHHYARAILQAPPLTMEYVPGTTHQFHLIPVIIDRAEGYKIYQRDTATQQLTKLGDLSANSRKPSLLVNDKGYIHHGNTFTYCASAHNTYGGESPVGTGNQCVDVTIDYPQPLPTVPQLVIDNRQQASPYDIQWRHTPQYSYTHKYHLYGGQGDIASVKWQKINSYDNVRKQNTDYQYQQLSPQFGQYSYKLEACNIQNNCVETAVLTVEHLAPYIQQAEYVADCAEKCFDIAMTVNGFSSQGKLHIQSLNTGDVYQFDGTQLRYNATTRRLTVTTTEAVYQHFLAGGLRLQLVNKVKGSPNSLYRLNSGGAQPFNTDYTRLSLNQGAAIGKSGNMYVAVGQKLYALDTKDGSINAGWPYSVSGTIESKPLVTQNTQGQERVYIGATDTRIYAFNASAENTNGNSGSLWQTKTKGAILSSPVIDANQQLYVASMDKHLYALDADNGNLNWQYAFPSGIARPPELLANSVIQVTTVKGKQYRIDRSSIGLSALRWDSIQNSTIKDALDIQVAKPEGWVPPQRSHSDVANIVRMFYVILDRAPTKGELDFFTFAYLNYSDTLNLQELINALLKSPDGKQIFTTDTAHSFISTLLKTSFAGQHPSLIAGKIPSAWVTALNNGDETRASVIAKWISSIEYQRLTQYSVHNTLNHFYNYCYLKQQCVYFADSDGDGVTDQTELQVGLNPTDPHDGYIKPPTLSVTKPELGQFTLSGKHDDKNLAFQYYELSSDGNYAAISALTRQALSLNRAHGQYQFKAKACQIFNLAPSDTCQQQCTVSVCSRFSNTLIVDINTSALESAPRPDPIPLTVAPFTPPDASAILQSEQFEHTTGQFRVSENGAATMTVPIQLPKGIAGVTPSLSLIYQHQGAEGIMGLGWSLSASSSVSRCRRTYVTDGYFSPFTLSDTDPFCLDGQRLILVKGLNGQAGAEYRTEIDSHHIITIEHGSQGLQFVVVGKDHSKRIYGGNANSRVTLNKDSQPVTFSWYLSHQHDNLRNSANVIEYHYDQSQYGENETVLKTIDYSGHQVAFMYAEPAQSTTRRSSYILGHRFSQKAQLQQIDITNHNRQAIRSYALNYGEYTNGQRRLDSIKECQNKYLIQCKTPLQLTYNDIKPQLSYAGYQDIDPSHPQTSELLAHTFTDLNGDGRNTLVSVYFVKSEKDWATPVTTLNMCAAAICNSIEINGDVDRDQFEMIAVDPEGDGSHNIWLNYEIKNIKTQQWVSVKFDKTTWKKTSIPWSPSNSTNTITEEYFKFGDLNHDGYTDVIFPTFKGTGEDKKLKRLNIKFWQPTKGHYSDHVELAIPTGVGASTVLNKTQNRRPNWQLHDFNFDGIADIMMPTCMSGEDCDNPKTYSIFITNVDRSNGQTSYHLTLAHTLGNVLNTSMFNVMPIDVNADGLTDIVYRTHWELNNNSHQRWTLAINTGQSSSKTLSFNEQVLFTSKAGVVGFNAEKVETTAPLIADRDGDGLVEIYFYIEPDKTRTSVWKPLAWSPQENILSSQGIDDSFDFYASLELDKEKPDFAYFVDTNHDGVVELIKQQSNRIRQSQINNPTPEQTITKGALVSFTQGAGLTTQVTYANMYDNSVYTKGQANPQKPIREVDFIAPQALVKTVTSDAPSSADQTAQVSIDYHYTGARLQLGGRGWLGFESIATTTHKQQNTIDVRTDYSQTFPTVGMPLATTKTLQGHANPLAMSTNIYKTTDYQPGLTAEPGTHYYQVYTAQSRDCQARVDSTFDTASLTAQYSVGEGVCSATVNQQDQYGNVTAMTQYQYAQQSVSALINNGQLPNTWLSKTVTSNTYPTDQWSQQFGRLSHTKVVHSRANQPDITRQSAFEYFHQHHAYNSGMLKAEIIEPSGSCKDYLRTEHRYDEWGNPIEKHITSKPGCASDYQIDRKKTWQYDPQGRYVTQQNNGVFDTLTILARNHYGQVTAQLNANGVKTQTVYDRWGNQIYQYSANGAQQQTLRESCSAQQCQYQVNQYQNGHLLKQHWVDTSGRTITEKTKGVLGHWRQTDYDYDRYSRRIKSQVLGQTNPAHYDYDLFDRLMYQRNDNVPITELHDYQGATHSVTLNDGSLTSQTQHTTQNDLAETATVTDADGNVLTYHYNAMGKNTRVHSSAEQGDVFTNQYDSLGRLTARQQKQRPAYHYIHNALGEIIQQTDGNGVVTGTRYDALGRKVQQQVQGEAAIQWYFDPHKPQQLHYQQQGQWRQTHYYDGQGRPIGNVTQLDNTTACHNWVTVNTNTADLRSQGDVLKSPIASRCVVQQIIYDEYGRVFQQFDDYRRSSSGFYIEARGIRNHYQHNQVVKQQEARDGSTGKTYREILTTNNQGQVTSWLQGGHQLKQDYDNIGRVKRRYHTSQGIILDESYHYDALNNLKQRDTLDSTEVYQYDNLNRLTHIDGVQRYHYTANGNLTEKDGWQQLYQGSHSDMLSKRTKGTTTETFHYDNNGNHTQLTRNGSITRNISYNARNKAKRIEQQGKVTTFHYDGNNRRYQRVDESQRITTYYVGGLELVIDNSDSSAGEQHYIKRYVAGTGLQTYYPNAKSNTANVQWLFKDRMGSIVAITNDAGKLLKRFSYDAFGQQSEIAPTSAQRASHYANYLTLNPFTQLRSNLRGYTGHEPITTDGRLIHMNGRLYDAAIGRMLQADPVVQAPTNLQNYNQYSYVLNNPYAYTDPSGYNAIERFVRQVLVQVVRQVINFYVPGLGDALYYAHQAHQTMRMVDAYFTAKRNGQESAFLKGAVRGIIEDGAIAMVLGDPSAIGQAIASRMLPSKPTVNYLQGDVERGTNKNQRVRFNGTETACVGDCVQYSDSERTKAIASYENLRDTLRERASETPDEPIPLSVDELNILFEGKYYQINSQLLRNNWLGNWDEKSISGHFSGGVADTFLRQNGLSGREFNIDGNLVWGGHVNYIGVGMLAAHYGPNLYQVIPAMVIAHNLAQVFGASGGGGLRNLNDIGPGIKWALAGATYYKSR